LYEKGYLPVGTGILNLNAPLLAARDDFILVSEINGMSVKRDYSSHQN
jgi:hypothetical protein